MRLLNELKNCRNILFSRTKYPVSFRNKPRKKNGFGTATKLGATKKFFVAATKNFAAVTKRFVDRTDHFVVVTKCFC